MRGNGRTARRTTSVRIALALTLLIVVLAAVPAVASGPMEVDGRLDAGYQHVFENDDVAVFFHADSTKYYVAVVNKRNENVFGSSPYHTQYAPVGKATPSATYWRQTAPRSASPAAATR